MVSIVNNVLQTYKLLREWLLKVLSTKENSNCEMIDVVTNIIVVIISQYICTLNHHIVYLKQCYIPILSPYSWRRKSHGVKFLTKTIDKI